MGSEKEFSRIHFHKGSQKNASMAVQARDWLAWVSCGEGRSPAIQEGHQNEVMQLGFHSVEIQFPPEAAFLASGSAREAEPALVDRHPGQRHSEMMHYLLCKYGPNS